MTKIRQRKKIKKVRESIDINSVRILDILLTGILIAGFLFRILNIDKVSLWVDEYVHVIRAQDFVKGEGPLFTDDNNGILLTFFILPFFSLFKDSAFWARIPSVLFGTGAIIIIYNIAKRLFNKYIGVISSMLLAFSLYNIYWSRLSRNYAIFLFFYLLMVFFFHRFFEDTEIKNGKNLFQRFGINLKYALIFIFTLFLSVLSHQLTFLFIFGLLLYFIINEIIYFIRKEHNSYKNKYFILSVISLIFLFLIFTPFVSTYLKNILSLFLPDRIVTWVIPDWNHLFNYYKETPFATFNKYYGVIRYDYPILFLAGIFGFIVSWFVNKKNSIFLLSMFVIPFIFMSFIFYDPSLPRYLIFIYPFFVISIAVFLYKVSHFLLNQVFRNIANKFIQTIIWAMPILIIIFFIQWEQIYSLASAKIRQGFLIDRHLSEWSFTDWEYPCNYVKELKQEGDIILSTVPNATNFYINIDSSIRFRQRYLDTELKQYRNFESGNCDLPCARSVEDIVRTLEQYEKGWLIADYYFYNVMTDPRARGYVCSRLDYHPYGSEDGGVLVFSWNNKNPAPKSNQSMLYVLGKSNNRIATDVLNIQLSEENLQRLNTPSLYVYARAVSPEEMYIVLNGRYKIVMPSNNETEIERLTVQIKPEMLINGPNTFQIYYNRDVNFDQERGFTLYHLGISN